MMLILTVLVGLAGCFHPQTRLQSDDEGERDKDLNVKTIGDFTAVANAEPIQVGGVGLLVGLEGTGGHPVPDAYRTLLEDQLRKRGVENVKEILASTSTALVLVSAMIPAGAHKGAPLDVEITLPPHSKTTSLKGGVLKECFLYNYESKRSLNPDYKGGNSWLPGHKLAVARGPVIVGFGDGDESARLRQGRIWGGGRSLIDRPFYLVLNKEQQRAPLAQKVAERINETLQGPYHGALSELAAAKSNQLVFLRVPEQYKHNLPRYLRVVRLIPLAEAQGARSPYRRRLEEELLDPKQAVTAALRLEALGPDSVESLKRGLQSEHALVRFCAAEALAYLGSPACGEELARMVEHQPALRAFSLTALASLDEAICHVKLRELLNAQSAETRYGAFRGLRALDEHDPNVAGELLNDSFWLHRAAPSSSPLVHVSCSRRAEVVLFGEEVFLVPPFSFLAGEFTLTAGASDDQCTLSRLSVNHGTSRRQCPLNLETVLRTLAAMGGTYPNVVDFLRQAGSCQCLTSSVAIDALPQATSVHDLAKNGSTDPDLMPADADILDARADFGATPTLFEKTSRRRPRRDLSPDEAADLHEQKTRHEKNTAARRQADAEE